jgi:hypothetical protein
VEASPAKSTAVEASSATATAAEATGMAAAAAKAAAATSTVTTTATAATTTTTTATCQRHGRRRQANCRDRCQRENRFTQHHHSPSESSHPAATELEIAGVDCHHTRAHLHSTPREKI